MKFGLLFGSAFFRIFLDYTSLSFTFGILLKTVHRMLFLHYFINFKAFFDDKYDVASLLWYDVLSSNKFVYRTYMIGLTYTNYC